MTEGLIAFLMAAGVFAWMFNQVQKQSGNNTVRSIMVAGIVAALAFMTVLAVLWLMPDVSLF